MKADLSQTPQNARVRAIDAVFGGPGEMRAVLRAIDWTTTSLGTPETWPPEARSIIAITLGMASPASLVWGPDDFLFYNDATIPVLGEAHPAAAGCPLAVAPRSTAAQLSPILNTVRGTGQSATFEDLLVQFKVGDRFEERYFTVSSSPVATENGIGGVFISHADTTETVLARRRTATLAALATVPVARTQIHALTSLVHVLGKNPHDVPFVLAYVIDHALGQAQLKASAGLDERSAMAPTVIEPIGSRSVWPLIEVIESRAPLVVSDLLTRFGDCAWGPWDEPTNEAILLPLSGLGETRPSGVLVVGLNRRRPLDRRYREFLDLVAAQVSAAIISAQAFLIRLSDTLRSLGGAHEVKVAATRLLGEHLGVTRAQYYEVDASGTFLGSDGGYTDGALPIVRRHRVEAFGSYVAESYHAGRPLVVADVTTDPRIDARAIAAEDGAELQAFVNVPLVKGGRFQGTLRVDQTVPRHWSAEEVALIEVVAARTWDAVDRVCAQTTLRESEAKYRTLFESMGQGYSEIEMIHGPDGRPIDHRLLELNPAFERLTGIRVAEAIGRTATEVTPGIDRWWIETYDRIAHQGYPERVEYELATLERWYEAHCFPRGGERLTVLYEDITERKRAEAATRANQRRQALLLKVADALRSLTDAAQIEETTCRLLGEHLHVDRAYYVDINEGARTATVSRQYLREGAPSSVGVHHLEAFEWSLPPMQRGETIVVDDVRQSELVPLADVAAMEAVQQAAIVGVPIVRGDALVAVLCVTQTVPRKWKPAEVEVVREVMERTWAAVERARAEAALRESEDKYRTVFESMEEGVLVHEMIRDECGRVIDYRLLEANPAHQRATGLPPETIGKLGSEFMPYVESYWLELFHRVSTTGVAERAEMYNSPTSRWYNVQVSRVRGHDRVAIVFDDVTARKQAQLALKASEERQAFLLELTDTLRALSDADAIKDAATRLLVAHLGVSASSYGETNGNLCDNPDQSVDVCLESTAERCEPGDCSACGEISRARRDLVIPDVLTFERFPVEERSRWAALGIRAHISLPLIKAQKLVATLSVQQATPRAWTVDDVTLIRETAERTWAAIERARTEAARERLLTSEADARRQAEEALRARRESEARLAAAFASVPVGIAEFGSDGKAVLSNAEIRRFLPSGIVPSRDAERGLRWQAWDTDGRPVPPHDWPSARALRGEKVIPGMEMLYTDDDGRAFWTNVATAPILDGAGQVTGCITVISDITERKSTEVKLREANRAKDEFLAMLGHELRNPLAPIVSTLELMRMEGGRKFQKEREMMLRQARHLAALLDDLLDVARLARGKIEIHRSAVALDKLVARAVEAAGPLIEQRRHQLDVDVAPGLLMKVDEKRIVQVISNLLNNAAHYTPPGGHIAISGERENGSVVLRVRDNGAGIAPKLLPHVFERFQQGMSMNDRSERGLGVGLAIVRSLVELHGGTVTAESEGSGKGSEFTVRLPARTQRASTPPPAPEPPSPAPRATGHRILLVDDNRNIADVLAVLLVKSGNIVEKAYDALSALTMASTFQPTLAIVDIGLPDMSGYELAKQLRKQKGLAHIELIALTGYGGSADRQRSKRAGFAEHLPKPVELEDLLATIERISAPLTAKTSRERNANRAKLGKPRVSKVPDPPTSKSRPRSRKERRS